MSLFELRKAWIRAVFGKLINLDYYPNAFFSKQFYWNSQLWSFYDKQNLIKNAGKPVYTKKEFCVFGNNGYFYVNVKHLF